MNCDGKVELGFSSFALQCVRRDLTKTPGCVWPLFCFKRFLSMSSYACISLLTCHCLLTMSSSPSLPLPNRLGGLWKEETVSDLGWKNRLTPPNCEWRKTPYFLPTSVKNTGATDLPPSCCTILFTTSFNSTTMVMHNCANFGKKKEDAFAIWANILKMYELS